MEEKVDSLVRPICTPWLCLLVFLEVMQYVAVSFASKVKWDTQSDWKTVPKVTLTDKVCVIAMFCRC